MQKSKSILICKVSYNWYQVIKSNYISNGSSVSNCWYPATNDIDVTENTRKPTPGDLTLFLVENAAGGQFIVGGGFYYNHVNLDVKECWNQLGVRSGFITFESFLKEVLLNQSDYSQPLSCFLSSGTFIFIKNSLISIPDLYKFNFEHSSRLIVDLDDPIGMYLEKVSLERRAASIDSSDEFGSWPGIYRKASLHKTAEQTARFKTQVLSAYNYKCPVTGCSLVPALSLAHIQNMYDDRYLDIDNALILRSDIHHLFVAGLITFCYQIDDSITVKISRKLQIDLDPDYAKLEGKQLHLPKDKSLWPRKEYLKWHNNIRFESWLKYGEFSLIDSIPMHPTKG